MYNWQHHLFILYVALHRLYKMLDQWHQRALLQGPVYYVRHYQIKKLPELGMRFGQILFCWQMIWLIN